MSEIEKLQKETCLRVGSTFVVSEPDLKVGIALESIKNEPLNALRHNPEGDTCGWYIWGGEKMSQDPDFFQPLHVSHINEYCPNIEKYLGMAPGWRVLIADEHEDIWFDEELLNTENE